MLTKLDLGICFRYDGGQTLPMSDIVRRERLIDPDCQSLRGENSRRPVLMCGAASHNDKFASDDILIEVRMIVASGSCEAGGLPWRTPDHARPRIHTTPIIRLQRGKSQPIRASLSRCDNKCDMSTVGGKLSIIAVKF